MPTPLKVLILEDSPNDILLLLRELRRSGFEVDHVAVSSGDEMKRALQSRKWDIILSDYSMGGFDALAALAILKETEVDIPFIITSGTVGEDIAVTAMKAGASDFFAKDKLTRLIPAVERELREAEGRRKRGEAEASFTTVFHASPIGILISRLSDGQVVDVNPRLLSLYGISREDIMSMKGAELESWVKLKQLNQITQQLLDTGSARGVEVEYQHVSGKTGYALLSAEIIELNNETCILSMVQDITDRKGAETALRTSEEKFRLLAENSTDMIARLTANGHFLYVSPASRTLLGYEPEELIGGSIFELFFPDDVQTIRNAYEQILGGQETNTVSYRIRAKDGRYVWFETISRTIRDVESNKVVEIQIASRDISERKASEQSMELYAERLELLHTIDLAILSADHPQSIAGAVLTRLQASLNFDSASITSFDLPKNQFTRLAAIAPIPSFYPFDDQSIIELLQDVKIYYVDDLGSIEQPSPSERALINAGMRSYVRIPLISSNKLLGAFSLCAKKPKAFLLNELDIAQEVGSQLAIVIENARLLEVAQRRNSELAALHQASLQLTGSLDIQKILDTVIEYAVSLIHANDAHIFLYSDQKLTFGAAQWDGEKRDKPLAEPRPVGLTYTVARTGKRLVISDVNQNPVYKDWKWGGAIIGLPLRVADEVNGVMSLAMAQPHQFDEHEVRVLELLADQAAVAVHNAQLYQQVQNHAKELEQRVLERTEQLQSATDRVVAILNNSSDSVILANSHGLIQQTNPGFNRQFGYERDALFNEPLASVVAKESIEMLNDSLRMSERNSEPKRIEVVAQRKDRTVFPADTLISTFTEGDELMVVYSLRDISRLKQVEIELRKALEKEKELNELKTSFTSIVSHEFRTPLSIILASSDSLIHYFDRFDQPQRIEKLENINRQVQRLVRLMDDVLTITRAESVGFEFRPRNLDLIALCHEIIEDVKIGYDHNITINFVAEDSCHSVVVDEFLFGHILQNLSSNAVKYSKAKGIVDIHLSCSEMDIVLRVEDHGIGIPKQHQANMFEAFRRAANVGQIQGTGIGMTIVKRAVEAHGGTIEFTSVEGVGTTFIVKLPIIKLKAKV